MSKKNRIVVGIDPGKNTGIAVWDVDAKEFLRIETLLIHQALRLIEEINPDYVRVEDARQRKWFGKRKGEERDVLQGAGSIKRDCVIWEDFLSEMKIRFEMVPPKSVATKLSSQMFKAYSKWKPRTTSHSRDAAMMVINFSPFSLGRKDLFENE